MGVTPPAHLFSEESLVGSMGGQFQRLVLTSIKVDSVDTTIGGRKHNLIQPGTEWYLFHNHELIG